MKKPTPTFFSLFLYFFFNCTEKASGPPQQKVIELTSLTAPQLGALKKQLDEEIEHLTASFGKLRAAQGKFRECLRSISDGVEAASEGKGDFSLVFSVIFKIFYYSLSSLFGFSFFRPFFFQ